MNAAGMAPKATGMIIPGEATAGDDKFTPSYVALDGKVLRFDAYMKEDVPDIPAEGYRIRLFNICYFLVDDSIRIGELKQENSGIAQGTFLKRHRVPSDSGGGYVGWEELRIGQPITVYGRTLFLTNCDGFTREYYATKGMPQGDKQETPRDPYFLRRQAAQEKVSLKQQNDQRQRFLAFNRKVLRFYCLWDDRNSIYGERRPFVLHFYLEDDTVEVCEVHLPNDGRDSFPKMLRRQKLPFDDREALKDIGSSPGNFYTDKDFLVQGTPVGARVRVFGRDFLIYDCDDFTKQHYQKKYGVSYFPNLTDRIRTPAVEPPRREIPPPTGFGTDADSLQSIYNLIPKAPKRDEGKLMDLQGKALRILGKFEDPAAQEDMDRKFVITFYLSDDTVSIFEPPQQNSGIIGGKFLERSQMLNPDSGENFLPFDFKLGAVVQLNKYRFRLLDCDEFTRKYIESKGEYLRSQLYKVSLNGIMKDLQKRNEEAKEALRAAFRIMDEDRSGNITHMEFLQTLRHLHYDIEIEDAEPLLAWFDPEWKGYISYAEFCDAIVRAPMFPEFQKKFLAEKAKVRTSPVQRSGSGLPM